MRYYKQNYNIRYQLKKCNFKSASYVQRAAYSNATQLIAKI